MITKAISITIRYHLLWDSIAGLAAFGLILLSQQMVSRVITLGVPKTTAIWVVVPLGEVVSVAFLFTYLRSTGHSIQAFIGSRDLRWWEVTLVPIGLFALGQLSAQAGNLLFTKVVGLIPDMGKAGAAVVPQTPLQYTFAILGIIFGGALCEEFIFRSYLIASLSKLIPRWSAAILTILLFGAIHIAGFGWFSLITLAFWAIPVTIYVIRSGKLIPAIIAHALNDLIVFLIFLPMIVR